MSNAASSTSRLAGRTALVTGSTRGLGRTMAEWLAREGASLIVSGREQDVVEASVAELRQFGAEAEGVPADLASVADAHRLAADVLERVDRLDILVNNAGQSIAGHFWDVTDEDWEYQVNLNWRAPFILAQHVSRHMIAKGIRGRIVNVSTIGAHAGHPDRLVYDAAKGAVEVMTRNMAYELGPYGISVNCVIPGNIAERPGVNVDPADFAAPARLIPFGRVGRAEDIAAAVCFFCAPESEFTTGQSLLIDGGHISYIHE